MNNFTVVDIRLSLDVGFKGSTLFLLVFCVIQLIQYVNFLYTLISVMYLNYRKLPINWNAFWDDPCCFSSITSKLLLK